MEEAHKINVAELGASARLQLSSQAPRPHMYGGWHQKNPPRVRAATSAGAGLLVSTFLLLHVTRVDYQPALSSRTSASTVSVVELCANVSSSSILEYLR